MAPTRLQVAQFQIVGGEVRSSGPYIGYFRARALGEAHLYVLVEPIAAPGDALSEHVVEVVGRSFCREDLSLTGALLRSLRKAQEELADWNRYSLREQQAGMGLSCLAVRQEEAYLAQVAPALAHVRGGGQARRLTPEEGCQPLGLAQELRPSLTRHVVGMTDAVLLAFSALAAHGDAAAAALAYPPEEALRRIYRLVKDLPRFAALLVAPLPSSSEVAHEGPGRRDVVR